MTLLICLWPKISLVSRIQVAEAEYKNSFDDELHSFKERIRKRAAEKVQEAIREAEEEERKARLGPGGLDPVEVYESLPQVRKDKCGALFELRLMKVTVSTMSHSFLCRQTFKSSCVECVPTSTSLTAISNLCSSLPQEIL